jgi:hypothetical protein
MRSPKTITRAVCALGLLMGGGGFATNLAANLLHVAELKNDKGLIDNGNHARRSRLPPGFHSECVITVPAFIEMWPRPRRRKPCGIATIS